MAHGGRKEPSTYTQNLCLGDLPKVSVRGIGSRFGMWVCFYYCVRLMVCVCVLSLKRGGGV